MTALKPKWRCAMQKWWGPELPHFYGMWSRVRNCFTPLSWWGAVSLPLQTIRKELSHSQLHSNRPVYKSQSKQLMISVLQFWGEDKETTRVAESLPFMSSQNKWPKCWYYRYASTTPLDFTQMYNTWNNNSTKKGLGVWVPIGST